MTEQEKEVVVQETPPNPLLEKLKRRMPGETFRLPSRALFYTDGELDKEVEDGEVIIYPMTTVDELKLRHVDMLFQGSAVTEVIARCVPQVKKPGGLIASDVDFILTCLRKVSFGPMLPIKHKCPNCDAKEKEYNVSIDHFIQTSKELSPELYNQMSLTLDEVYTVKLKPCTFDEFIKVLQRTDEQFDTAEKVADWMNQSLAAIIRSVDKITNREQILEWLADLPRSVKEELTQHIEVLNKWGLELSYEITCDACQHVANVSTSLNPISFFTLPSSQKTP